MTPKHWFQIIGSALAIFFVGIVGVRVVNAGVGSARSIVNSVAMEANDADLMIPVDGIDFKLNDAKLGTLQKMAVLRNGPSRVNGFDYTIHLNDGVSADQFANCELTVNHPDKIDAKTTFSCLRATDPGYKELVRFGSIFFESDQLDTQHHKLMVPRSFRDAIVRAQTSAQDGNGAHHVTSTSEDNGDFSLNVNGMNVVDIHGGENHGDVVIRDPKSGKIVVEIHGDDNGGSVKVNGETKVEATTVTTSNGKKVNVVTKGPN